MNENKLYKDIMERFFNIEGEDAIVTDSEMTEYILDNCEIVFEPDNRFFCLTELTEANIVVFKLITERFEKEFKPFKDRKYEEATDAKAFEMFFDFGHTTPNWRYILEAGFSGLKKQAEFYAAKEYDEPEKTRFYTAVLKVYNAGERFINRVIEKAEAAQKDEIAQGLRNLLVAPPQNLFEAMQLQMLFYTLQHSIEETFIRSFGRVDQLLYPFYIKEDKETARKMVRDYVAELQCQNQSANQPFSLGGTDKDGNCLVNELSYAFLEEYIALNPPRVKIHVLCADDMPEKFLKTALDGIRKGANSILFMGDSVIKKSLNRLGIEDEDIIDYHVDGCYECGGFGETTNPATARISIAKAIELALNGGKDIRTGFEIGIPTEKAPESFEEFLREFYRQLSHICKITMDYSGKMEMLYPRLHAGLLFTSSYPEYMEKGTDVYVGFGAKYNDTSINGVGLGTAVDSLMSIKKLVYDDKKMSLPELNELMKNNWEGEEALRITAKNKFPKYGTGDAEVDGYAADIVDFLGKEINKKPNVKGGVYRLGMMSIKWRWSFGEGLAATPDGRLAGETTSLNTSASFGADREGATGHILSMTSLDSTNSPNGAVLDLDLHYSAVKGESGLNALYATLKTFLDNRGFAVHYNVLNADVLREAQKNPQDYPNLQVRVCGWNNLFSNLGKAEQDEYIIRAEGE